MRQIDADALSENLGFAKNCKDCKIGKNCTYETFSVYGICTALADAPTVGGWISVKDRLPDIGHKVLTYSKFGHISDRVLERHGGMNGYDVLLFSPDGMKPGSDIPYWMPLPEPPKEES